MLTFLILMVLAIIIYFVVRKLVRQQAVIDKLRNELTRLNKLQAKLKK